LRETAEKLADTYPQWAERKAAHAVFRTALKDYAAGRFQEASAACDRTFQGTSDPFWAQYLRALCQLRLLDRPGLSEVQRRSHAEQARVGLTACLVDGDFRWVRLLRGVAHVQLHEFADAENDFGEALKETSDKVLQLEARINRGASRVLQRRLDEARSDLEEAVRLRPEDYRAHANLARVHQERNDLNAALTALRRALELRPGDAALLDTLGDLHRKRDEPRAARRAYENCIAAPLGGTPLRSASARVKIAYLLQAEDDLAGAVDQCLAALHLLPDFGPAHRELSGLFLRLDQRSRPARRGVVLGALGLSLSAEGQGTAYAAAGRELDLYLRTASRPSADVWVTRGLLHSHLGEHSQARNAYSRATALQPDPLSWPLLHGTAGAVGLPVLLALRPDVLPWTLRGWTYLTLKSPELALADFDIALQGEPAYRDALCGRGHARALLGYLYLAQEDARAALELRPPTPRWLVRIAGVHARVAGHPEAEPALRYAAQEEALQLLRRALKETPEAEQADFWRQVILKDPALMSLRGSTGMLELDRRYRQ
jgi:tetratricopeptide (TPR) repeat protein